MHREFIDTVDKLERDGESVSFTHQPGCYFMRRRPEDVRQTLREALHSGRRLRVTVDAKTLEIADAVPA